MKAEDFSKGQEVIYTPKHAHGNWTHADCERGVVFRQNGEYVFVQYYRNGSLLPTAQATRPDDLVTPN